MVKKIVIGVGVFLLVVIAAGYIFREPLKDMAIMILTEDMFLEEDTDTFDPGVSAENQFPAVRVSYQGEELSSLMDFAGPRGLVIMFSRSVVW